MLQKVFTKKSKDGSMMVIKSQAKTTCCTKRNNINYFYKVKNGGKMDFEYELGKIGGYLSFKIKPNSKIVGSTRNIEGWLESDVQCFGERYLSKIKTIIENADTNKQEVFSDNTYEARVKKDYTTISRDIGEEWPEMAPCTLPTSMLCEILQVWIKLVKDYSERQVHHNKMKFVFRALRRREYKDKVSF